MSCFCDVLCDISVVYREDEKEKKDEKSYKSVFEQFGISKPTLQMNPFTGKSIPTSVPKPCSWKKFKIQQIK